MKNIVKLLLMLVTCFTLYSCVTPAQAQIDEVYVDSDGHMDVRLIITNGVPYYTPDNVLMYYVYRGHYYKPRYFNGRIYAFDKFILSQRHPAPRLNPIPPRTRPNHPNIRHRRVPNNRGGIVPRNPQRNGSTPMKRPSNRRH